MWRPLIELGSHSWIGSTEQPGIRIGRREGTPSAVTLNDPVFLWPLLENHSIRWSSTYQGAGQNFDLRRNRLRPVYSGQSLDQR